MNEAKEIDPRIVRVGIEVNGKLKIYEGLSITATGTKYANANQNECEVKIANLQKDTADYILSETSPFNKNKTPKILTLDAGRKSYGTSRIFLGNISKSSPSQPPDIAVTLKCLTLNYKKGDVTSDTATGTQSLKDISQNVAKDLNVNLNFQATDKNISNYNYSGASLNQVDKLGELGDINAYIDDGNLIVKDANIPLVNTSRIVNVDSGMIGIPEITEHGIKVKFLLDNKTTLGGGLQVESLIYPAVNGNYVIFKLGFEISSRDVPFYWVAEGKRL
jgi:hypothetical protein